MLYKNFSKFGYVYGCFGTISLLSFIAMDKEIVWTRGGGCSAMLKRKLNYRFHNPNSAVATADYILKILIDANSEKVERAIHTAADQVAWETECEEVDSA